jgi:aspartyl-tRNA(Asn)/glutamyl-tRNA(Gln) amidotransferase subunit C
MVMAITQDDVKKIAHLARLHLDENKIPGYTTNLDNILNLVNAMNAVDTQGIAPMSHPFDMVARVREDVVTEPNLCEELMAIAPESEMGLYLVPQVIE